MIDEWPAGLYTWSIPVAWTGVSTAPSGGFPVLCSSDAKYLDHGMRREAVGECVMSVGPALTV